MPAVQRDAAEELDIEVRLLERARARFPRSRERPRENVFERLSGRELLAERGGHAAQLIVREGGHLRLQEIHLIDDLAEPPDLCLVAVDEAEQLGERAQSATAK